MCINCNSEDILRRIEKVVNVSSFGGVEYRGEYNCYKCDTCRSLYFSHSDLQKNEYRLILELLKPTTVNGITLAYINSRIGKSTILSETAIREAIEKDGLSRDTHLGKLILQRYVDVVTKLIVG